MRLPMTWPLGRFPIHKNNSLFAGFLFVRSFVLFSRIQQINKNIFKSLKITLEKAQSKVDCEDCLPCNIILNVAIFTAFEQNDLQINFITYLVLEEKHCMNDLSEMCVNTATGPRLIQFPDSYIAILYLTCIDCMRGRRLKPKKLGYPLEIRG